MGSPVKLVVILAAISTVTAPASVGRAQVQGAFAVTRQPDGSRRVTSAPVRALLNQYCVSCHNERLRTSGLSLETIDFSDVGADAEVWEKVLRKLRLGAMPPAGRPRPDRATSDVLISSMEAEIDRVAARHPNPGRTETFHRLNRAEYQNAVRDILGVEVDVAALLPPEDGLDGFDNIAEGLSLSPALMDRYMTVARRLSRLGVGLPPPGPVTEGYSVPLTRTQDEHDGEELPFGSRGGIAIRHAFPIDGNYIVKVGLRRSSYDYILGLGEAHQLDVRVDGTRLGLFTVGGEQREKGRPAPSSYSGNIPGDPAWEQYALHADASLEARFSVKAGTKTVTVAFLDRLSEPEGVLQPYRPRSTGNDELRDINPAIATVVISGPHDPGGIADTPSRRKIFVCRPSHAISEDSCARRIISTIARRAFRRTVNTPDVQKLFAFFEAGRQEGGFEAGIQFALERILVDPQFLFRVESDPPGVEPGAVYRLTDMELASRLAFFLWSSVPDDALLDAAADGKLKQPRNLERQVRRMLADSRARALVTNFAGQWLYLRNVQHLTPDPNLFADFDDNLREAFTRETELFIESQLRSDRSVLELLSADYTFLNERLARHYRIPNVHGSHFRRVMLSDPARRGVLGHASILAVTSYPTRTSPVLRGKWLLETILGAPPPPPPPDVPGLPERSAAGQPSTVRARLEQHRKNPTCATCHAPMDPLGFALENFDALGVWRTNEGDTQIDASGIMPDGSKFDGPAELRALLMTRKDEFVRTLAERLLAYALGRQVEYYDMPAVRAIVREAAATDYRWSSLIGQIVTSPPFQMRRARAASTTESERKVITNPQTGTQ